MVISMASSETPKVRAKPRLASEMVRAPPVEAGCADDVGDRRSTTGRGSNLSVAGFIPRSASDVYRTGFRHPRQASGTLIRANALIATSQRFWFPGSDEGHTPEIFPIRKAEP